MDLSPRDTGTAAAPKKRRKWGPIVVLGLVIIGGGVVVSQFLTSAIDYYCNADEIGVKDSCSGERRVRVQGTVDQDSIVESGDGGLESFTISFNGASVPVDYSDGASLPDLFQPCIPVVVEGRLTAGVLAGTNIEVKHSEVYEEENPDRVDEYGGAACSQGA